ncbi:MAG: carboxypeptidase regulatory-like domain-containing protein, partial [Pyrinomonadaceae bacterium]|nr:carboxypeptidase regulatory-like domain-containing protein [Pyrinomonadaceae bacterium]
MPAQTVAGSLKGQVTDQLGAIIVGANVTLVAENGAEKSVMTNGKGIYTFLNLASGSYVLRVTAQSFALYEQTNLEIVSNSPREINVQLSIAVNEQKVTVGAENSLSSESENNASAIRLRDNELEILPDDPAELEAALRALAGVSGGPDGGQIIIDGFVNTGQPLPPRSSIREIRINQNPFSAENDRLGFGQIQIITRPGTDKLHGEGFFNFTDESLNTRNPFAANRAPYQMRFFGGSLSGAILPKRASFFASFNRRETADNVIVNAAVLDENLNFSRISRAFVVPRRQINFNSRFDAQLTPNNTLTLNYNLFRSSTENAGIGGINLPERAYEFL